MTVVLANDDADAVTISTTELQSGGDRKTVETEEHNHNRAEVLRKRLRHLERVSLSPRNTDDDVEEDDADHPVEEEEEEHPVGNKKEAVVVVPVNIEAAKQRLRLMEQELTSNGMISSMNQDAGESTTSSPVHHHRRTRHRRSFSSAQVVVVSSQDAADDKEPSLHEDDDVDREENRKNMAQRRLSGRSFRDEDSQTGRVIEIVRTTPSSPTSASSSSSSPKRPKFPRHASGRHNSFSRHRRRPSLGAHSNLADHYLMAGPTSSHNHRMVRQASQILVLSQTTSGSPNASLRSLEEPPPTNGDPTTTTSPIRSHHTTSPTRTGSFNGSGGGGGILLGHPQQPVYLDDAIIERFIEEKRRKLKRRRFIRRTTIAILLLVAIGTAIAGITTLVIKNDDRDNDDNENDGTPRNREDEDQPYIFSRPPDETFVVTPIITSTTPQERAAAWDIMTQCNTRRVEGTDHENHFVVTNPESPAPRFVALKVTLQRLILRQQRFPESLSRSNVHVQYFNNDDEGACDARNLAIHWLASIDPLQVIPWQQENNIMATTTTTTNLIHSERELLERFILLVFYFSAQNPQGDDGLVVSKTNQLRSVNNVDPTSTLSWLEEQGHICQWSGITCGRPNDDNDDDTLSIVGLERSNLQLQGTIPPELGWLSNLTVLNLESNQLKGTLPAELLHGLTNLQTFSVGFNQLEGSIPTEMGNMSSLTTVNLSNNSLSGQVPTQLGVLKNLVLFLIQKNDVSGVVPEEVCSLNMPVLEADCKTGSFVCDCCSLCV